MQQTMFEYQFKLNILHSFVNAKLVELNKRIKSAAKEIKAKPQVLVKKEEEKSKSPAVTKR
jgi:hypothetical protein